MTGLRIDDDLLARIDAKSRSFDGDFKPMACWLHPLHLRQGKVATPAEDDDTQMYTRLTMCGKHNPQGQVWREALAQELRYLKENYGVE